MIILRLGNAYKHKASRAERKIMKKYKVILEDGIKPIPQRHEISAAQVIARYTKSNVLILRCELNSSPDLKVLRTHQRWELKSPIGNGKRTIANNLRDASHQSDKVILDLSRCKLPTDQAIARVKEYMHSGDSRIKKLLIIKKDKKVIDFKDLK